MDNRLRDFLNQKADEYNTPSFIEDDPVLIPHLFTKKQDIEIAGFFAAVFAWGIRTTIINKSRELMRLMDMSPHDFILNHEPSDLKRLLNFKHRTFNATDLLYFVEFLRFHYRSNQSLEDAFIDLSPDSDSCSIENSLNHFNSYFFSLDDVPSRTRKHIAAPYKKSTCKRLNMYLRWMVRKDNKGVDLGIWKRISPSALICPVDVHVARVAKRFKLLNRKQVDWEAAVELTASLRQLDPNDPVKYDFALFALGILERF